MLGVSGHEHCVVQMLQARALGYVLKNAVFQEITHAIRTVAVEHRFLCTEIGLNMPYRAAASSPLAGSKLAEPTARTGLTARELEVLKLIAEDLTDNKTADKLFTSKHTTGTHRQDIISKTGAKNTAALIRLAIRQGIISWGQSTTIQPINLKLADS